ncbi:MAG: hypothetical protein ACI4NR_00905 [Megasphaera sp.]|uniref:hypothetical protein n=1 Tax=Megasphaera sp. TaxID=2023260 RepID=UPI003F08639E
MDLLTAVAFTVLMLTALLPAIRQTAETDRRCQIEEALWRQEVSVADTLFKALRYGQDFQVFTDEIRFVTPQGLATGFAVRGQSLFVRLSDGNYQPLTGGGSTAKGRPVLVLPCGSQPFFAYDGRCVQASFLLTERRSGASWPLQLTVRSLNDREG